MNKNENKVTIIKSNGGKNVNIPFNCHLIVSKKIAIQTISIFVQACPLEMSKCIITETSTHLELKVNLPDSLCDILANAFKKYGSKSLAMEINLNHN